MFNHHRGLWGYTGEACDGEPLTIQATGMGGPSAAIVLTELIALGVRRAIRTGTCGALGGDLALGDLVVARAALCRDGTSRSLGSGEQVRADAALTEALLASAPGARAGTVASVDLFYGSDDHGGGGAGANATDGAIAVEMEAAALFAVGAASDVPVACVLAVSDTFDTTRARTRIDDHALLGAAERMGAAAVAAMPAPAPT
jgi:uridine phosphorylase